RQTVSRGLLHTGVQKRLGPPERPKPAAKPVGPASTFQFLKAFRRVHLPHSYASRDLPLAKPETKNPDLSVRAFRLVDRQFYKSVRPAIKRPPRSGPASSQCC